jgi:hypothetical protein
MAQENEHIQTLAAELEHRREVAKALAEVADQALADEERVASVMLQLLPSSSHVRRSSQR